MKINIPGKRPITMYPSGGVSVSIPGEGAIDVNKPGLKWILRDDFTTDLAAGSVNGTAAEPGPGTRTVTDVGNHLSISGGQLISDDAGSRLSAYPAITRTAGRILIGEMGLAAANYCIIGFATDTAATNQHQIAFRNLGHVYIKNFNTFLTMYDTGIVLGTHYYCAIILRATGAFYFIKGGIWTNWTLLYSYNLLNTATLYPTANPQAVGAFHDLIRIPDVLWLPTPLVSDGFGGTWPTSDGAGHAETTGLGSGGGSKTWTANLGTWGSAAGVASCSELDVSGVGIATTDCGTANIHALCTMARTGDNVGNVWRYIDADNYLFSYHDGTNFVLKQRLATVESTLITAAVAIGAGAMQITLSGVKGSFFLNNVAIGTPTTGINAAFSAATKHGLYTTNIANTLDNFVVHARGDEGQINAYLNKYSFD